MSNRFHLAIAGGDLSITVPWYQTVLGCKLDMSEEGKWQDIDFWGNELTLHATSPRDGKSLERERYSVDMGDVYVPHFGIHLPLYRYNDVKDRVQAKAKFLDTPYTRFDNTRYQQETFFVEDPNYNVLEIKSMLKEKIY